MYNQKLLAHYEKKASNTGKSTIRRTLFLVFNGFYKADEKLREKDVEV